MKIAERIKRKRIELRETQEQFGKRFGTSAMGVSYWERGMRRPNLNVLDFVLDDTPLTNGRSIEGRLLSLEAKVNELCEMSGLSKL